MQEIEIVSIEQFQRFAQYIDDNVEVTFQVTENGVKIIMSEEVFVKAQQAYYADTYIFEL